MNCEDTHALLGAYGDGELDAASNLRIESHLRACAGCTGFLENQRALNTALRSPALRFKAPAALRESILGSLTTETFPDETSGGQPDRAPALDSPRLQMIAVPSRGAGQQATSPEARSFMRWAGLARAAAIFLVGALAGSLGFLSYSHRRDTPNLLAQEIVSGHVRSLLPGDHLTDVLSSDRHTVKPWFEGKLDFAPPVADLAAQGFPLIGGRLDYLNGRTVASIIYRRDKHIINVFVWPLGSQEMNDGGEQKSTHQGYHLLRWHGADMQWWTVSDLNETELAQFASLLPHSPSN